MSFSEDAALAYQKRHCMPITGDTFDRQGPPNASELATMARAASGHRSLTFAPQEAPWVTDLMRDFRKAVRKTRISLRTDGQAKCIAWDAALRLRRPFKVWKFWKGIACAGAKRMRRY